MPEETRSDPTPKSIPAEKPEPKPEPTAKTAGQKSSEYRITKIAGAALAFIGIGLIIADMVLKALGKPGLPGAKDFAGSLLATGLPILIGSYALSRGIAKIGGGGGLVLVLLLLISPELACAKTFPAALAGAHESLKTMSKHVEPPLAKECRRRGLLCVSEGVQRARDCKPLFECRQWMTAYAEAKSQIHGGLARANRAFWQAKKAGVFK